MCRVRLVRPIVWHVHQLDCWPRWSCQAAPCLHCHGNWRASDSTVKKKDVRSDLRREPNTLQTNPILRSDGRGRVVT